MSRPDKKTDPDNLLPEVHAAEMLSVSSRTLQAWRSDGAGPPFVRIGRAIRYRVRDLLSYIDQCTIRRKDDGSIGA